MHSVALYFPVALFFTFLWCTIFLSWLMLHVSGWLCVLLLTQKDVPIHGSIHFYYVIMACTYLLPLSYKLMVISSVATKNKFSGRFILVDLNRFSSLLYTSFSHSIERCQQWQCWHQRILQQQKKLPRVKFHLMIKSLKLILLS